MKSMILLCVFVFGFTTAFAVEAIRSPLGHVASFTLTTIAGDAVSLDQSDAELTVLCFLGTECPLAKLYGPRLQTMSDSFGDRVRFIGVNSNVQDSVEELKAYAAEFELTFAMVKDEDRSVALSAGAKRTPEVVVVDRVGAVRYRGRIDNQYEPGIARADATEHDLRNAIDQLLAGKPVTHPVTKAVGCLISLPRESLAKNASPAVAPESPSVTYCNEVVRVLQKHCVECHRTGEIGPFTLDDYDEVAGWADMMVEVVDNGRMPPWHATDNHAKLANARIMPTADKQVLRDWAAAGTPYGNADDLPTTPTFVSGWQLPREPDLVLEMRKEPFHVPADGVVDYQYYVAKMDFPTDRWVKAAEVIPGNRGVVHHAIAFIRPPDGSDFRKQGLLSAYVPGQRQSPLPDGYAQRIPAGSRIVFQMHYTPTGKPETDITKVGMVFVDEADVTHEVSSIGSFEQDFEIPPHAANYDVNSKFNWFPRNGEILSVMPHMHLRGKSFRMDLVRKPGSETLLEVPAYDFNWQHNYELENSIPLADVEQIRFTATFDNSADNPANPDPTEHVTWGDQTWQEMAVVFMAVARPREKTAATTKAEASDQTSKQNNKAAKFAKDYIQRFDANADGVLTEDEVPHSVRLFAFRRFDHDGNGQVSREEIEAERGSRR